MPAKPTYISFAEDIDFFDLFKKINSSFDTCFLLESLGSESSLSRYSIIGFDPKHIIRANETRCAISGDEPLGNYSVKSKNPYSELRRIIPQNIISRSYAGGAVGYLNYDAVNYFEPALKTLVHPLFNQYMFGIYTDGLVLDKITGTTYYFFYTKNREHLIKKIMASRAKKGLVKVVCKGNTITKTQHKTLVEKAKEEIKAGNTFQVQIGFKTEYEIKGDPIPIYEKLRIVNPSPHMFYLKFGKVKIIGASPELLFRMQNREMETYPLAGTCKRGKNETEDRLLARSLLNDKKEQAEHNMLIDLHRNDLGRVANFGTVKVRRLMDIKKFSHVQHISSEIAGIMKPGEDMFSGLANNFPAGTLTGAPKIETMKIIDALEGEARGPYGGAVGHFGFNGDCTFTIPIRSLFISDNYAYTQNSSGIVYDSVAEREYEEVKRKGEAMRKVMEKFKV